MYDYLGYDATIGTISRIIFQEWVINDFFFHFWDVLAFRSVGHSTDAMTMLDQYLIGILPRSERLYDNRYRW